MADLEFFFDPVCPFAWITSRWVTEAQQLRDYDITWRFISLAVINEEQTADWYTPSYRAVHVAGHECLRVCDEVRLSEGNEAVARVYTVLGTAFHPDRRRDDYMADRIGFMEWALTAAGLDPMLAKHLDDESHDAYIRAETALAFERTGKDVGTPILTFRPDDNGGASFFGPVISSIPRGEAALKLWDAIETVATTSGMAELKRSNRAKLNFD